MSCDHAEMLVLLKLAVFTYLPGLHELYVYYDDSNHLEEASLYNSIT
jgi:hypothetical protein